MGNSCCQLQQRGGSHHNKHGIAGSRVGNRRSASSVSPSGNTASGNPGLSLDQDVRHPQITQDANITIPSKVQKVNTEGQQVASTTAAATAIASPADESSILKGDKQHDMSEDCKKNGLFLIPKCEDEEDVCPTCLDGYEEENPKIMTKCKHHYHLSCILEWKERSDNCPVCDKVMAFEEASLV